MKLTNEANASLIPWKLYLTITAESLLAFYIASFSLGMFFIHRGEKWMALGVIMGMLYLVVICICAKRILSTLPIAAIMLIIPIAPLIALIIIVTLIPVIEMLQ